MICIFSHVPNDWCKLLRWDIDDFYQRDISLLGGPTRLPRAVTFSQTLRVTSYSFPHLQARETRFPSKRQKARGSCVSFSFLPFLSDAAGPFLEQIPSDEFSTRPSTQEGKWVACCSELGPNHRVLPVPGEHEQGPRSPVTNPSPMTAGEVFLRL